MSGMMIISAPVQTNWAAGMMLNYRGWMILAEQQGGRRFWTVRTPVGFPATETSSSHSACLYIDARESDPNIGQDIFVRGSR